MGDEEPQGDVDDDEEEDVDDEEEDVDDEEEEDVEDVDDEEEEDVDDEEENVDDEEEVEEKVDEEEGEEEEGEEEEGEEEEGEESSYISTPVVSVPRNPFEYHKEEEQINLFESRKKTPKKITPLRTSEQGERTTTYTPPRQKQTSEQQPQQRKKEDASIKVRAPITSPDQQSPVRRSPIKSPVRRPDLINQSNRIPATQNRPITIASSEEDDDEDLLDYRIPLSSEGGLKWYYKYHYIPEHLARLHHVFASDYLSRGGIKKKYALFVSLFEAYTYVMSVPEEERHYYIVIKERTPCRLYLDYDFIISDALTKLDTVNKIKGDIDLLYAVMPNIFFKVYGRQGPGKMFIFNSSHDNKISLHIEFDAFHVQSNKDILPLVLELRKHNLPLDERVYTKNRLWRLPYNSKLDSFNTKRLLDKNEVLPGNRFFITDISATKEVAPTRDIWREYNAGLDIVR
jgi:hypothetical protein